MGGRGTAPEREPKHGRCWPVTGDKRASTRNAKREQARPCGRTAPIGVRYGGRLLGEWHDAAPAERYSAKALWVAARGTQPYRTFSGTRAQGSVFPVWRGI